MACNHLPSVTCPECLGKRLDGSADSYGHWRQGAMSAQARIIALEEQLAEAREVSDEMERGWVKVANKKDARIAKLEDELAEMEDERDVLAARLHRIRAALEVNGE